MYESPGIKRRSGNTWHSQRVTAVSLEGGEPTKDVDICSVIC